MKMATDLNYSPSVGVARMGHEGKSGIDRATLIPVKGILHQKNFYRLNLIFWIVMGCGIARFSWRGLKTTET